MPRILSAYGYFDFPAPETWPADSLRAFARVTGERSLLDVFIFARENSGDLYMEDAVLALSVLPVTRAEWSTRSGYPQVTFELSKLHQYTQGLADAGYRVVTMEKCAEQAPDRNGKVVSIAIAHRAASRRRHKWA